MFSLSRTGYKIVNHQKTITQAIWELYYQFECFERHRLTSSESWKEYSR